MFHWEFEGQTTKAFAMLLSCASSLEVNRGETMLQNLKNCSNHKAMTSECRGRLEKEGRTIQTHYTITTNACPEPAGWW